MKDIWTEDAETIHKEVDFLVEHKIELVCARRGSADITKLTVVGKANSKNGPLFVLLHPHEPTCSSETCTFYYHSKGSPLRVFECKRAKKAEKFVGFEFPKQIFNIHRRKHERVTTPNNSVGVFSFLHKQRIYNGTVADISLEGARLLVDIPGPVAKDTTLCHVTLTICYRISKAQIVLLIPEVKIAWSKFEQEITNTIGIQFLLSEKDQDALSNYIELRTIEESYKEKREFY